MNTGAVEGEVAAVCGWGEMAAVPQQLHQLSGLVKLHLHMLLLILLPSAPGPGECVAGSPLQSCIAASGEEATGWRGRESHTFSPDILLSSFVRMQP